jgi:hypothetical protein
MSGAFATVPATTLVKEFTINLAQNAGTYDLFTASGDVVIHEITFYVAVAGVGLTSFTVSANDTTVVPFLTIVLLAAITIGKNLTPYSGPSLLASGKKGQYTIIGNGSAGSITAAVRYSPATAGASLS